jgi:hypothetical protein
MHRFDFILVLFSFVFVCRDLVASRRRQDIVFGRRRLKLIVRRDEQDREAARRSTESAARYWATWKLSAVMTITAEPCGQASCTTAAIARRKSQRGQVSTLNSNCWKQR